MDVHNRNVKYLTLTNNNDNEKTIKKNQHDDEVDQNNPYWHL